MALGKLLSLWPCSWHLQGLAGEVTLSRLVLNGLSEAPSLMSHVYTHTRVHTHSHVCICT